jgi:hypothetical protein
MHRGLAGLGRGDAMDGGRALTHTIAPQMRFAPIEKLVPR